MTRLSPNSHSRRLIYSDAEPMSLVVLPIASFDGFMRLTAEEHAQRVATFLEQAG